MNCFEILDLDGFPDLFSGFSCLNASKEQSGCFSWMTDREQLQTACMNRQRNRRDWRENSSTGKTLNKQQAKLLEAGHC